MIVDLVLIECVTFIGTFVFYIMHYMKAFSSDFLVTNHSRRAFQCQRNVNLFCLWTSDYSHLKTKELCALFYGLTSPVSNFSVVGMESLLSILTSTMWLVKLCLLKDKPAILAV